MFLSRLARSRNYVRIAFAGFLGAHLLCEAYRAASAGALPEPGFESAPWLVAATLLVVWLPFLIFAVAELTTAQPARDPAQVSAQERALAKVEPLALLVVLAFSLWHAAEFAWPLLSGRLIENDVRPVLIATLSSTHAGLPLQAIAMLGATGAGSFYAVRQLQKAAPGASVGVARALVALGVLGYLLGSYAVIRCASGALLPDLLPAP